MPTITIENPVYNGQKRTFYAYAKDSNGKKSLVSTAEYKMYNDKVPQIELFTVDSVDKDGIPIGNLTVKYQINAVDDFETTNELKFELLLKNGDNYTTLVSRAPLSNFVNKENQVTLPGVYDGNTRYIVARVYDKNNVIDTKYNEQVFDYEVYKRDSLSEEDVEFDITSTTPCINESACSEGSSENLNVNYSLSIPGISVSDYSNILVCVSENETCTNYSALSEYMTDGGEAKQKSFSFTPTDSSKPYDGSTKKLHVYVQDKTVLQPVTLHIIKDHEIYKNNKPYILVQPTVVPVSNNNNLNLDNVTYSLSVIDDLDTTLSTAYCKKLVNNDGTTGAESCTDYSTYSNTKNLDSSFFNVSSYDGQKFMIYSKIKDSYGAEETTDEVIYVLYKDQAPSITTVDAVYDYDEAHDVTSNYRVSFKATDYSDTYTYCISNSDSTCTTYSTTPISGDDNNYQVVNISSVSNDEDTFYLYLKDSKGKISKRSFVYQKYAQCEFEAYGTSSYTYEDLDSSKTYKYYADNGVDYEDISGSSNKKITIDLCSGKCYGSHSSSNNIYGYYLLKVNYKDRFNTSTSCDSSQGQSDDNRLYKASCDFHDCFKKGDSYVRRAIGLTKHDDPVGFTYDSGSGSEICYEYYNVYTSSYTAGDQFISLTKTPDKVCASLVDSGKFDYKASDVDPYVRVDVAD